jgi:hypothetical protein
MRALVIAALISVSSASAQTPALADVMRRAHLYVLAYEDDQLSSVIATEHYHQRWQDSGGRLKEERTLLSDFLIFQLPPEEDYFALRDVREVDSVPVTDRHDVMERLRSDSAESMNERAMEIARQSARFNLGQVFRTVNLPTYPLRFLRPGSRFRFKFQKVGEEQVAGASAWVIAYEETGRPTFSSTLDGDDLPAHGRFWIVPETGVLLQSEMVIGGTRRVRDRAAITVSYAQERSLGFHVPIAMRERYDRPRERRSEVVEGLATYSNYRLFDARSLIGKPSIPK